MVLADLGEGHLGHRAFRRRAEDSGLWSRCPPVRSPAIRQLIAYAPFGRARRRGTAAPLRSRFGLHLVPALVPFHCDIGAMPRANTPPAATSDSGGQIGSRRPAVTRMRLPARLPLMSGSNGISGCISTAASNSAGSAKQHRSQDVGAVRIAEPDHRRRLRRLDMRADEAGHLVGAHARGRPCRRRPRRCGGRTARRRAPRHRRAARRSSHPAARSRAERRETGSRRRRCHGRRRAAGRPASRAAPCGCKLSLRHRSDPPISCRAAAGAFPDSRADARAASAVSALRRDARCPRRGRSPARWWRPRTARRRACGNRSPRNSRGR